jgi:hypothetical protein
VTRAIEIIAENITEFEVYRKNVVSLARMKGTRG